MKNLLILVLILSNVIYFSLSKNDFLKENKISANYRNSENKENNKFTSHAIFEEESENKNGELIRKTSKFSILFTILFLSTFICSGIYSYYDVLHNKLRGQRPNA